MPCHYPLQAFPSDSTYVKSGKRVWCFSRSMREKFFRGEKLPSDVQPMPCGRCMSCRLEKSRQVAVRCVHESRMYENNCFVTLTYSPENLVKMCPLTEGGYSLVRKHVKDFIKRLREKFSRLTPGELIRVYGCGEYGDDSSRPHYHLCLFNCDFSDKKLYSVSNGFKLFNSEILSKLWPYGHAVIGDFSFETAAYVARYCTKKVTGEKAESHYKGRLPEFPIYPTRGGGLGKSWFEKYGKTDVFPTDSCISNGAPCKVPRYYDRLWERQDPVRFVQAKLERIKNAEKHVDDNTFARLLDKEQCMNARIRLLVRKLEKSYD